MERALEQLVLRATPEFDVVLLAAWASDEVATAVEWRRIRVPQRPKPILFAGFYLRAGLLLRRLDADLVHLSGALVPNRAGLASVQFCHAAFVERTGRLAPRDAPLSRRLNTTVMRRMSLAAERRAYRGERTTVLLPASRGVDSELARFYPESARVVITNGVDRDRFRPDAERRRSTRAEIGTPESSFVALFVGGDWDRKGLAIAIRGVALAARQRPGESLELWVVGGGDRPRFELAAREAGIRRSVRFLGRRSDTERFFSGADVFVFPTLYEAFPLVVLEAAASGLPVLAPRDVNGVPDVIGDETAGIYVERDASSISAALEALRADDDRRVRMSAAARDVSSAYAWDLVTDRTLAVWRDLLGRERGRP